MPRNRTTIITLEEAKVRFEAWRQNRKGKAAIPDELWAAAVEVARKEGVSRTSTELRVEWEPPEASDGSTGSADIAETCPAGVCGTGGAPAAIGSRMHRRTGRPSRQDDDSIEERIGFVPGGR